MANNNQQPAVDIPLDAFLGLVTESDITSLPPGASPDQQDLIFTPGSVDTRPCLHRIFPAGATTTYTYEKTFIQPNGQPLNLYLDSAGIFWQEDVTNNPGVKTQVAAGTPGLYAQSVTAFGREYIAFSDGLHGADIPRQYDGTNYDRVTQEGPAAAPSIADIIANVNITSVTLAVAVNISGIASVAGTGGALNIATFTTAAPHGLVVNQAILVQGATVAGYNGVFAPTTVPSATTFTVVYAGAVLGASGAAGGVGPASATIITATPHGMFQGDAFTFTGNAGTLNNSAQGNPTNWVVSAVTNATTFTFALSNQFGLVQGGQAATTGGAGGVLTTGGMITVGLHQMVCMFLTRSGYITAPSPSVSWSALGNKQATATNIPIGPANVVARILAFTGTGGSHYFYIPLNVAGGAQSTVINDNTTTSLTIDFSDNTLFASIGIDILGNNLFAQRVLGPCLGFTVYGSRLGAWGEYRRVENFLNMGFDGGFLSATPTVPLYWTIPGAGGALVTGAANFGGAWQITGDGTNAVRGLITQTAFQDRFNIAIIAPNTQYSLRVWAKASAAGLAGNLQAILSGTGFTATASIPVISCSTQGGFVQAKFNLPTPAVIPADLILSIQEAGGLNNLATITIDDAELIFTNQPYIDSAAYFSYINNPEGFDAITGKFQASDDDTPIRFFTTLRSWLIMATAGGLHRSIQSAGEPAFWSIDTISGAVGALSFRAGDPGKFGKGDTGEEWIIIGGYGGAYLYGGGPLWKISQENQPIWDRINKAAQHTLWIKNDSANRRIYFALPLDQATSPNALYPLDYRELDTDQQIAAAPPVRTSGYSGKTIATDMARKWTRWNISANCGEIMARPGNTFQFCLGAGNGVTPGQQNGFGNIYFLDSAKLTDDDYGGMVPYWVSHLFPTHDQEQQLQLGSYQHLFQYSAYFVSGVGQLVITPYAGSLVNPRPASVARTLNLNPLTDIEIPLNVTAARVAFKIAVIPLQGQTDVKMSLSKMIITIRKNAMAQVRGAK